MIRSILVPLEKAAPPSRAEIPEHDKELMNPFCGAAARKAVEIARAIGADLHFLHVEDPMKVRYVDMVMTGTQGPTPVEPLLEEDLERIDRELKEERGAIQALYDAAKASLPGRHSLDLAQGDGAEEIFKASRRVDLVVMEKSEGGRLPGTLFDVIRHASTPVLVVSEAEPPACGADTGDKTGGGVAEGGVAVAAFDGSRSSYNMLRVVGDLTAAVVRRVLIVTCGDESACLPYAQEARTYFRPYGIPVETRLHPGKPDEAILEAARETGAWLIAMGGYGDNPVKEILVGSTTEAVLTHAQVPVLVSNA
jgi:nucleotide-binding universal stress UspA family protein